MAVCRSATQRVVECPVNGRDVSGVGDVSDVSKLILMGSRAALLYQPPLCRHSTSCAPHLTKRRALCKFLCVCAAFLATGFRSADQTRADKACLPPKHVTGSVTSQPQAAPPTFSTFSCTLDSAPLHSFPQNKTALSFVQ